MCLNELTLREKDAKNKIKRQMEFGLQNILFTCSWEDCFEEGKNIIFETLDRYEFKTCIKNTQASLIDPMIKYLQSYLNAQYTKCVTIFVNFCSLLKGAFFLPLPLLWLII